MNRRGFLKAAGGLAVAAPVAAAAPRVGAMLGGEWAGGALAAGMAANLAPATIGGSVVGVLPPALWNLYRRYSDSELRRTRWLEIYRQHRIRVRRGREERKPAKLLWLLEERRDADAVVPTVDRKNRIRNARVRRLIRAAGFPGLPWEVPCSK